jgi:type IV secretory pathway TrbF-like protein
LVRPFQTGAAPEAPANSLLDRRAPFLGAFADLAKAKRSWQLACFALLLLLGVMTFAYIRLSSQAHITPYVVEVDQLGRAVAFGPAEQIRSTDNRIVVAELSRFISNVRTVYTDPYAQRDALYRAYAYATSETAAFLDEHFRGPDNDPRLLAQRLTREVDVDFVLQIPKTHTWRVQWEETDHPRAAGATTRSAWEAYLTVVVVPPTTAEALQKNPIGLWVRAISWTRVAAH